MGSSWENIYKHLETVVGGGYYSLRKTKYGSSLVKTDRSPSGTSYCAVLEKRVPSVGHNDRRQTLINRRNNESKK